MLSCPQNNLWKTPKLGVRSYHRVDPCVITEQSHGILLNCSIFWATLQACNQEMLLCLGTHDAISPRQAPCPPMGAWLSDLPTSVAEASRFYHGKRLQHSHATTQCLNKRVCLIQLSARDCAKSQQALCDSSNKLALWVIWVARGRWWREGGGWRPA